ncbi:MAG TPA: hypothetical protein VIN61_16065 [Gammaproteobacteria bacterium]
MYRRTMKFSFILALALGLFLTACDSAERVAAPTTEPQVQQAAVVTGPNGETYTLVRSRQLLGLLPLQLQITDLISLKGGSITLLGHTLTVPAGAVTSPTLFTMLLGLNGYVEVHLEALSPSLLGGLLNIGGHGFRQPVRVTLSYANAADVVDPSRLVIVHLPGLWGYDRAEPVPTTVDPVRKTVTAELDHFSRYALAWN